MRFVVDESLENSSGEELAGCPAEIDKSSEVSSQNQRTHFHGICWAHGSECSPGNGAEESTDKHGLDVRSEEGNEDERSHQDQRNEHHNSMSVLLSKISISQRSDDITDSLNVGQTCLPLQDMGVSKYDHSNVKKKKEDHKNERAGIGWLPECYLQVQTTGIHGLLQSISHTSA